MESDKIPWELYLGKASSILGLIIAQINEQEYFQGKFYCFWNSNAPSVDQKKNQLIV